MLENLKDYAVKALVNTIDHLGTVAYNMNEVLYLQISEISSTEVRVASLAQVCIEALSSQQRRENSSLLYLVTYQLCDGK